MHLLVIPLIISPAFADANSADGGIVGGYFSGSLAVPVMPATPGMAAGLAGRLAGMAANMPAGMPANMPAGMPANMPAGMAANILGNMQGGGARSMVNAARDLCGPAIASASTGQSLPPGLLHAIAVVESGKLDPQTGVDKPWPWTIDANGAGFVYPTEQAAVAAAASFQSAGVESLDIGCLQVNLLQHPDAFANLQQAFDPAANAQYAARFLNGLEQKFDNWPQAVAAYHSQTPALGGPYQTRVYAQWQGDAAPMALAAATPAAFNTASNAVSSKAETMAAMAPPQPVFALTSLAPPMQMLMRSNNTVTGGRSLAAYRLSPVPIATSAPAG